MSQHLRELVEERLPNEPTEPPAERLMRLRRTAPASPAGAFLLPAAPKEGRPQALRRY